LGLSDHRGSDRFVDHGFLRVFAPGILMSPLAGALVDRWNRKGMMALADFAAGLATVFIMVLYVTGNLQLWHIYLAGAFSGFFSSFHWPAYSAAVTLISAGSSQWM
jgi:DHA3 family macrolide efflux protein-like MFS transporter